VGREYNFESSGLYVQGISQIIMISISEKDPGFNTR
jgi:hypothetical protein